MHGVGRQQPEGQRRAHDESRRIAPQVRRPAGAKTARRPGNERAPRRGRFPAFILMLVHLQIFDKEQKHQRRARDNADTDRNLDPARKIAHAFRPRKGDDAQVEAVAEHAENRRRRGDGQPRHACAHGRDGHQRDRQKGAQGDFEPEQIRLPGAVEGMPQLAAHGQIAQTQDGIQPQNPGRGLAQLAQQIRRYLVPKEIARQQRLHRYRHQSQTHGRDKKQHINDRAIPQRMRAIGRDQEQRAERRLVQRAQHDAGDDQDDCQLLENSERALEKRMREQRMLQRHGSELQRQHRQIQHHAHRHLEQNRVVLREYHRMPDAPGKPQIVKQAHGHRDIAEKGGQDRRPDKAMEAVEMENIDGGGQHESSRRQRHSPHHIERDPQPPRRGVRQIRCRAQTLDKARRGGYGQDADEEPEDGFQNAQSIHHSLSSLAGGIAPAAESPPAAAA
ncbi:MAG: hypothetical protein BWZ10_00823 [candidate division BRC1 bacterium ADurb.BinA364]|nr:MAG: hypothetical protein BWZ10_00823 [candidate division BRC1 bacterium ADurb.BinA364]